ncbi:MAG: hypothetical protein WC802_05035 [Patescibacteria group bacterium]|jgi:hypothetical protein
MAKNKGKKDVIFPSEEEFVIEREKIVRGFEDRLVAIDERYEAVIHLSQSKNSAENALAMADRLLIDLAKLDDWFAENHKYFSDERTVEIVETIEVFREGTVALQERLKPAEEPQPEPVRTPVLPAEATVQENVRVITDMLDVISDPAERAKLFKKTAMEELGATPEEVLANLKSLIDEYYRSPIDSADFTRVKETLAEMIWRKSKNAVPRFFARLDQARIQRETERQNSENAKADSERSQRAAEAEARERVAPVEPEPSEQPKGKEKKAPAINSPFSGLGALKDSLPAEPREKKPKQEKPAPTEKQPEPKKESPTEEKPKERPSNRLEGTAVEREAKNRIAQLRRKIEDLEGGDLEDFWRDKDFSRSLSELRHQGEEIHYRIADFADAVSLLAELAQLEARQTALEREYARRIGTASTPRTEARSPVDDSSERMAPIAGEEAGEEAEEATDADVEANNDLRGFEERARIYAQMANDGPEARREVVNLLKRLRDDIALFDEEFAEDSNTDKYKDPDALAVRLDTVEKKIKAIEVLEDARIDADYEENPEAEATPYEVYQEELKQLDTRIFALFDDADQPKPDNEKIAGALVDCLTELAQAKKKYEESAGETAVQALLSQGNELVRTANNLFEIVSEDMIEGAVEEMPTERPAVEAEIEGDVDEFIAEQEGRKTPNAVPDHYLKEPSEGMLGGEVPPNLEKISQPHPKAPPLGSSLRESLSRAWTYVLKRGEPSSIWEPDLLEPDDLGTEAEEIGALLAAADTSGIEIPAEIINHLSNTLSEKECSALRTWVQSKKKV